jgi:hypothetical protein
VSVAVHGQKLSEAQVPPTVLSAFKTGHPGVTHVKWEKEGPNYEGEFKTDGKEQSVVMDAQGAVLETETQIAGNELPAPIKEYLEKNYKGAKIGETSMIISASGELKYEVEIRNKDLLFDSAGNFLRAEDADKD